MKSRYDYFGAIASVEAKPDARIEGNNIVVKDPQYTVGIGTWGAIDYLVSRYKYRLVRVAPQDF